MVKKKEVIVGFFVEVPDAPGPSHPTGVAGNVSIQPATKKCRSSYDIRTLFKKQKAPEGKKEIRKEEKKTPDIIVID